MVQPAALAGPLPGGSWLGATDLRTGWTAGAGVEWMFLPRWSVKAEYLYYDLGTANTANVGPVFYTSSAKTGSLFSTAVGSTRYVRFR